mmetsp:Transcript_18993/g.44287  ORF Transcript_18993/g.44287 Transcript_18993/m.44287 type:complete len:96 (-) Transcript_18993:500-787(-)
MPCKRAAWRCKLSSGQMSRKHLPPLLCSGSVLNRLVPTRTVTTIAVFGRFFVPMLAASNDARPILLKRMIEYVHTEGSLVYTAVRYYLEEKWLFT